jgi:hypothetical protein
MFMKKKLLALAVGISVIQISQAQISKGSLFLGGSLGFGNFNNKSTQINPSGSSQENKNNSWAIRPQIGRAFGENKILGIFVEIGGQTTENIQGTVNQTQKSNFYGGGFFYRQYYPLGKRFFLHGEAALGVEFSKSTSRFVDGTVNRLQSDNKGTAIGLSIAPGISFAASRKLFLEASLNSVLSASYQSSKGTGYNFQGNPSFNQESNGFGFTANANGFSNISIGLRWILPTKK